PFGSPLCGLLAGMLSKKPDQRPEIPSIILRLQQEINSQGGRIGGTYEIENVLVRTGPYQAYKAKDLNLSRSVVIKILSLEAMNDPSKKDHFLKRARQFSRLDHPNLVKIYGVANDPNTKQPFYFQEFVLGETLDKVVEPLRKEPARLSFVLRQLVAGVEACRKAGVVHGQLQPSAILVDTSDRVKILDFNLIHDETQSFVEDIRAFGKILEELIPPDEEKSDDRFEQQFWSFLQELANNFRLVENEADIHLEPLLASFDTWRKTFQDRQIVNSSSYSPKGSPLEKQTALKKLIQEKSEGSLDQILLALKSETEPEIIALCLRGVAIVGGFSQLQTITPFLANPDPILRLHAVEALRLIGNPRVCLHLFGRLSDADMRVKKLATQALKLIGKEQLQEALQAFVLFGNPEQQEESARALRFFPNPESLHLLSLLEKSPYAKVASNAQETRLAWDKSGITLHHTSSSPMAETAKGKELANHFIVCGFGLIGQLFVEDLLRKKKTVVVLENNLSTKTCEILNRKGIRWISGSGLDPSLLLTAGILRAKYLITLTDNDDTNLEIALKTKTLLERSANQETASVLQCFVHIFQPHLRRLYYRYVDQSISKGFEPRVFSLVESASRQILRNFSPPPSKLHQQLHEIPLKILIIGFNSLAMFLCAQIARQMQGPRMGLLEVTVVDRDITPKSEQLRFLHPKIEQVLPIRFVEGDPVKWVQSTLSSNSVFFLELGAIYICSDSFSVVETVGDELRKKISPNSGIPIVRIWPTLEGAPTSNVPKTVEKDLFSYQYPGECCKADFVVNEALDVFAQALHSQYYEGQREGVESPTTNPSSVPWDSLPGELKDANRSQADHIIVKLRSIGCSIGKIQPSNYSLSQEEIQTLARVEHCRWLVYLLLNGWKYGPVRDLLRQTHPSLLPWDTLPENAKAKNIQAIACLPEVLALMNCGITRPDKLP
ncbi:MAG: NAD-binding protein, partial [Candidatus Ozemobacteraceae bacterium]